MAMVLTTQKIKSKDVSFDELEYVLNNSMRHNRQIESNQRPVALPSQPRSPCSPTAQRTAIYQLTPASYDVMSPKTNLPAPLEAMSNVLIHQQREPGLPVIDGLRGGAIRPSLDHHQAKHVMMPPPPVRSNAKRNHNILRSSLSDSFLHSRVELLEDALNTGTESFRGLEPSGRRESRRPSTPIVESASKAVLGARRQLRKLSLSDQQQTRTDYDKKTIKVFSDAKMKQQNRRKHRRVHSKGDNSSKDDDVKDLVKEIENGSFCLWKEKTRSLRRASQTSSKNMDGENQTLTREDGRVSKVSTKQPNQKTKREETVIRHLNYCSSRKTNQVVNWLKEVNKQDSFEVIE